MSAIKPVSDLRNYNEVLSDVHEGSPVFLTKKRAQLLRSARYEESQPVLRHHLAFYRFHQKIYIDRTIHEKRDYLQILLAE